MFNLRTLKILRDLSVSKARTILIILTIAIGAFAVSAITRSWLILSHNLSENYMQANPASATLLTAQPFSQQVVEQVQAVAGVSAAAGRNGMIARVQIGPGDWRPLRLIVRPNFNAQSINQIRLQSGDWPLDEDSILIERSSLAFAGLKVGEPLRILMPDGREQTLNLSGAVHDITLVPSLFSNIMYGYMTSDAYRKLTTLSGFNAVDIVVADAQDPSRPSSDLAHIRQVVEETTAVLKDAGLVVSEKRIPQPLRHPLDNIIQSVLQLLIILAALAVFLSSFLVINSISALIAQQVRQIGAIKAVGGRSGTIGSMYLNTVFILGALAGLIAIPLGMITARFSSSFIAGLINFDITAYPSPWWIYAPELFASLAAPLLAALAPIWSGTRITVREAVSSSGSESNAFGAGWIDRALNALSGLPAAWLYALRNIFRKKVRLLLALVTLTAAGGIFIAVFSVRSSLEQTIDEIARYWQEDISLRFYANIPTEQTAAILAGFEAVEHVEMRLLRNAFLLRPDGSEATDVVNLVGLAADTPFLEPELISGRWLDGESPDEIVVNIDLLAVEPGIQPGDRLTLRVGRNETAWTVVGVVTSQVIGSELLQTPTAYANYNALAAAVNAEGRTNQALLQISPAIEAGSAMRQLSIDIERDFAAQDLRVAARLLHTDLRTSLIGAFDIILSLIQLMSILFALVGALGLAGMMSLSVLERTREIGVIRVVGAVQRTVAQIIIIEGVFIGLLSWVAGSLLAYPLSLMLNNNLGLTLLRIPLTQVFPPWGALLWLGLVMLLSALASLLPALSAARLSVRETMSFE